MVDNTKVVMMDGITTLADLIAGVGVLVCTTASKPTSPFEGQVIYVTDNAAGSEIESWDGSAWQTVGSGGGLGTNETSFTIDKDNVSGTAAITELKFNRGEADAAGIIQWDEASGPFFEFLRLDTGDATKYKAAIMVHRIYIDNTDTYLERDTVSPYHLVLHCNGIDFE
ncbi:MAG: hypothetical protein PHX50_17665 [Massilibacteroides sp.]|nr:hypothetical protein [Massilibacteroides sp.]